MKNGLLLWADDEMDLLRPHTMVYIGGACPPPEEIPERPKKNKKKENV